MSRNCIPTRAEHNSCADKDKRTVCCVAVMVPSNYTGVWSWHFNTNKFNDIVSRFKSEVNPESSWNCVDDIGEAGTYLISGMSGNNTTDFKFFAFIAHLNGNGYLEGNLIDLGGFSDTFTNNSAVIALKSGVTFKTGYGINITRLGV